MTTRSTFGFGLEHIVGDVFCLWIDDVGSAKEVRRCMIVKKMRMMNHKKTAFKLGIVSGREVILFE